MSRGYSLDEAWGKLLGTIMLCVWLEALISFIPNRILKKIFPPYVLGITVMLIGVQVGSDNVYMTCTYFYTRSTNGMPH